MNIFKSLLVLGALSVGLAACGERVEVPPAYEGKILTKNGYKPETIPPSIFRLDPCIFVCDRIVLIQKQDVGVKESFRLFMPKDRLNVNFDIRMTATIKDGKTDSILDRISPTRSESGARYISFQQVYDTYALPIIRESIRSVISKYTIDQLNSSRDAVNAEISEIVNQALNHTPIGLKTIGLADIQFPAIITEQQEAAAKRREEIAQQEARKQIQLIQASTALEVARANRAVRREQAEAAAEENEIFAKSMSREYLEYRKLEVLQEIAKSGTSVFVPFNALDEVGLSQKVFNQ